MGLVYCVALLAIAAVPHLFSFFALSTRGTDAGTALVFAVSRLLAYAILLAGGAGLLYKVVADGVATADRSTIDRSTADR